MAAADSSKESILTAERLRSVLAYDPDTGVFIWLVSPNRNMRPGSIAGCRHDHKSKHRYIKVDGFGFLAHRLAWLYMTGEWPKSNIDHKDCDGANNRWSNLRLASAAENLHNVGLRSNNSTGHKGVTLIKSTGRYRAAICAHGRRYHLGVFDCPEEASVAYARAAAKYHGKFARVS